MDVAAPQTDQPLRILEVGFGRGLNTAMAMRLLAQAGHRGPIQAWGCEPNPHFLTPWPTVPDELAGYAPWWGYPAGGEGESPPEGVDSGPHIQAAVGNAQVHVHLQTAAELLNQLPADSIDWIFLDLFSPAKHEEDWQAELWPGLAKVAAPSAVLTSYTCARRVRDGLQGVGWQCEVLRRPSYRDTLRARFLASGDGSA